MKALICCLMVAGLVLAGCSEKGVNNPESQEEEQTLQGANGAIGWIGDTLDNSFYRLLWKRQYPMSELSERRWGVTVEVENIGNGNNAYIGPFNFWILGSSGHLYVQGKDSEKRLGGSKGTLLLLGQKVELEVELKLPPFDIEPLRWLLFQAYEEVMPLEYQGEILFYPKGKPIGAPIIFGPL